MIFTINKGLMCRQQTTHHLLSWFVTAYLTNPKNNLLIFYKFISENQRFVSHIFEGNHLSVFRINTQILPSDYMQYFSWSILMWINPLCCIFWDAQSSNYVATSWEPWYRLELWNTTQPQVTKPWFVRSIPKINPHLVICLLHAFVCSLPYLMCAFCSVRIHFHILWTMYILSYTPWGSI